MLRHPPEHFLLSIKEEREDVRLFARQHYEKDLSNKFASFDDLSISGRSEENVLCY